MAHSHLIDKVCGNHSSEQLKLLNEYLNSDEMIIFSPDENFEPISITDSSSIIQVNSWEECAFYLIKGSWLPPGFVPSNGQLEATVNLFNEASLLTYLPLFSLFLIIISAFSKSFIKIDKT